MFKLIKIILVIFLFQLCLTTLAYSDTDVEFGVEDDLTVNGTAGTSADADLEVKGYSVFGTGAGATSVTSGSGSLYIQNNLELGGSAYLLGNSGIGTTTASARLQIQGADTGTGFTLRLQDSNKADKTAFLDNGNVGIGTTSPITQLHIPGKVPTAQVGSVATGTNPLSVYVQGRYAYTVDIGSDRLRIFDVSNPASPVSKSSVATGTDPWSVYVQGRYAYVANWTSNTLQVFDVSNPSSPSSIGSIATGSAPRSVYVQGRYAYVVHTGGTDSLQIFDVSNPASLSSAGSVATCGLDPHSVYVQGRYAYVGNNTSGSISLEIFDVSNPASPTIVGSVIGSGTPNPQPVYVQGRYVYTVDVFTDSLRIFDVSNPAAPLNIGSVTSGLDPRSIYVQGRYAYVAHSGGTDSLQIFDVSNPASPTIVGSVATGAWPSSLYVQGRYAYVVNYTSSTLQIFDVGGSYIQQLETGGLETGTLTTRSNAQVGNDLDVRGGLQVGRGIETTGPFSVYGGGTGSNFIVNYDGNVGIGTTAPSARLHIEGNIKAKMQSDLGGNAAVWEGNWLSGYSYRKLITISASNVDEDLSNFPIYVRISGDTDIGAHMTDTDTYYDIRFTDTNNNLLPYEQESMSISDGSATGNYWVAVNLDDVNGATIYCYYGKSGDTDGSNPTGVWDSNFKGVWHSYDNPDTSTIQDSTTNNYDGTKKAANEPIEATGQIGNAQQYDGTDDYVDVGDVGNIKTISYWINANTDVSYVLNFDDSNKDQCIYHNSIPMGIYDADTYIDGVSVSQLGSELVTNGNFDSGISGWLEIGDSTLSWQNAVSGDGSTGYLRFTINKNSDYDRIYSTTGVTSANTTYIVSFWYKTSGITGNLRVYSTDVPATLGTTASWADRTFGPSASWKFVSFVLTVDASDYPTFGISKLSDVGAGTFDVDAISVKEIDSNIGNAWHQVVIATGNGVNASNLTLGKVSSSYFNGIIDEVRISNTVRSASWIKFEYYNMVSTNNYEQSWAGETTSSSTVYELGYDVAEVFETTEEVTPGDLLISESSGRLKKSTQPYQENIIGVVSAAPALLFEGSQLQINPQPLEFKAGTKPPVALSGRVKLKVTLENGFIRTGDYLTSSSKPGYAMKATQSSRVIGLALENADQEGQITVFINPHWYGAEFTSQSLDELEQENTVIKVKSQEIEMMIKELEAG